MQQNNVAPRAKVLVVESTLMPSTMRVQDPRSPDAGMVVRPVLTVLIDIHSREMLALHVSAGSELEPAQLRRLEDQIVAQVPCTVRFDNGRAFDGLCARLQARGVAVRRSDRWLPSTRGRADVVIEGLHRAVFGSVVNREN